MQTKKLYGKGAHIHTKNQAGFRLCHSNTMRREQNKTYQIIRKVEPKTEYIAKLFKYKANTETYLNIQEAVRTALLYYAALINKKWQQAKIQGNKSDESEQNVQVSIQYRVLSSNLISYHC